MCAELKKHHAITDQFIRLDWCTVWTLTSWSHSTKGQRAYMSRSSNTSVSVKDLEMKWVLTMKRFSFMGIKKYKSWFSRRWTSFFRPCKNWSVNKVFPRHEHQGPLRKTVWTERDVWVVFQHKHRRGKRRSLISQHLLNNFVFRVWTQKLANSVDIADTLWFL